MAESGEEAHQLAKNTMVDAMKQAGEAEGFATVYDPSRFGRQQLDRDLGTPRSWLPYSRKPQNNAGSLLHQRMGVSATLD